MLRSAYSRTGAGKIDGLPFYPIAWFRSGGAKSIGQGSSGPAMITRAAAACA